MGWLRTAETGGGMDLDPRLCSHIPPKAAPCFGSGWWLPPSSPVAAKAAETSRDTTRAPMEWSAVGVKPVGHCGETCVEEEQ